MTVFITEDGVVEVPFPPMIEAMWNLLASERRVFSKEELFERLWGYNAEGSTAMQMRVSYARRIMAKHGIYGKIVTRRGVGYMVV